MPKPARCKRALPNRSATPTVSFPQIDIPGRGAHHHERTAAVDGSLQSLVVLMAVETEIAAQSSRTAGGIDVDRNRFRQAQLHVPRLGDQFRIAARLLGNVSR